MRDMNTPKAVKSTIHSKLGGEWTRAIAQIGCCSTLVAIALEGLGAPSAAWGQSVNVTANRTINTAAQNTAIQNTATNATSATVASTSILTAIKVLPEQVFLLTTPSPQGVQIQRSEDRRELHLLLPGVQTAADFRVPSDTSWDNSPVDGLQVTQITTEPALTRITVQVDPNSPNWQVTTHPEGLSIAPIHSDRVSQSGTTGNPPLPLPSLEPAPLPEPLPSPVPDVILPTESPSSPLPRNTSQSGRKSVFTTTASPLFTRHPLLPTAQHLRRGEVTIDVRNRLYDLPGGTGDSGTAVYPAFSFNWGIRDDIELSFGLQTADSGSPDQQGSDENGNFFVERRQNLDIAIEGKKRLWQNADQTQALSAVLGVSFGSREIQFFQAPRRLIAEEKNSTPIPMIQFPYTASPNERLAFTIAPTVAFFRGDSAIFLARAPIDDPGSFGTTFGFAGGLSWNFNPRLSLWADAFVPITGNNAIGRRSGKATDVVALNAGVRYLVNPRLALDFFASNTLGTLGPLALTADGNFTAVGIGVEFMPDFIRTNRRYPDRFGDSAQGGQSNPREFPTTDGLAFFDGGVAPRGQGIVQIQGGGQGVLTALRYSPLRDLETGIYLDYITSGVDESEQGFSLKLRLLNQQEGDALTGSLGFTVGLTNQNFRNFQTNNRDAADDQGLRRNVPFLFTGDEAEDGELFIFTASFPLHYAFDDGKAIWLTPTLGLVQREGVDIAGFTVGGSIPINKDLAALAEVGFNFAGQGNSFIGDELADAIPWAAGIRWNLNRFVGQPDRPDKTNPQIELYLTNRVGSTPFQSLRVRVNNNLTIGAGVLFPF